MNNIGIPLTTVRSNASTTGARKPNPGNTTSYESSADNGFEKSEGVLHKRHAGRRRRMGSDKLSRRGTDSSDEISVNALGRFYAKIVGFSVITRYMVYIVPVGIILAVPVVVFHFTKVGDGTFVGGRDGPTLFYLFLWILITWCTLWLSKIAAWVLPKLFMFFCGIVSMGVRKYATVLKNMSITLSLFFWALAAWLSFKGLFNDALVKNLVWVVNMERVLGALFVSLAVLLAEKALVQLIGVSYHQRSFANRIKASKREIHLLGLLYDASRALFPMYCQEFAEEDYIINDSIEMMLRGKKGKIIGGNGAATPMKIIGDVGRFGDKVTSVVGHVAKEITGKQVFNPNSAHSIVLEALEKRLPSEALGRRIWMSFVLEGKDTLYLEDFEEVLGPAYKQDAEEAFNMIDSDSNGDISLDEMVRKTVEMGTERKAIGEGMKDIGQALRVFDKVLMFVVLLITIFIFLAFFRSSIVATIATAGTALLSLSFVFAVTTQEFLGSCIFLFVKHPYDVGDRIEVGGTQMLVERISLLYTVFTKTAQNQVTQVPNIVLNNLWIDNVTRSKAMTESFKVDVSYDTSFEDIELLRAEMEKFVRHPDNSRDFKPDFIIGVAGVGDLDKLTLEISIQHKSNWHNGIIRATRRSKFMCALALALKKVPIYGPGGGAEPLGGPANPTYSVAVTDEWASKSRDAAAQEKDAARIAPLGPGETEADKRAAEEHAAAELNARSLAVETSGNWGDVRDDRSVSLRSPRSPSEDRQRVKEIETVRSELLKKESQRGRRKAGEGLQTLSPTETHGTHPAQGARLGTFDEEAQTGIPQRFYSVGRSHEPRLSEGEERLRLTASRSAGGSAHKPSRGPSPGHR
ncbi:Mechanosensitive ion channel family protein [Metarhizium album ARSEF 1941]|uniref:Mechanosensitive ion channel protein n=1 Tax=Metarhizium album (strain ARSEF 1941) TaxID=1081103 RepID=A0A0B2WMS6_METAS|nr:Mechanosensitive ion channel family protein [Metarhizium album ARSEF 1941]KHN97366.1 Mechanosensitive ion channel family protein [Metarhizium album ARSEF 1941]